eukprot:301530_1
MLLFMSLISFNPSPCRTISVCLGFGHHVGAHIHQYRSPLYNVIWTISYRSICWICCRFHIMQMQMKHPMPSKYSDVLFRIIKIIRLFKLSRIFDMFHSITIQSYIAKQFLLDLDIFQ